MGQEDETVGKPRKEEHTLRLSAYHSHIARRLADKQGVPFAEVLTKSCEQGLVVMANADNQMNIWERTSAKKELIDLVDGIPQDKLGDAIAFLQQLKA